MDPHMRQVNNLRDVAQDEMKQSIDNSKSLSDSQESATNIIYKSYDQREMASFRKPKNEKKLKSIQNIFKKVLQKRSQMLFNSKENGSMIQTMSMQSCGPGPGAYQCCETHGLRTNPRASIGNTIRFLDTDEIKKCTPGPGCYNCHIKMSEKSMSSTKRNSPKFIFPKESKQFQLSKVTMTPGPQAYSPEKCNCSFDSKKKFQSIPFSTATRFNHVPASKSYRRSKDSNPNGIYEQINPNKEFKTIFPGPNHYSPLKSHADLKFKITKSLTFSKEKRFSNNLILPTI